MEYIAKIIGERRTKNKQFWQYYFLDLQTGQEDRFYNNYRINYVPDLVGKLNLLENNKYPKLFQSFEQDVNNVVKEFQYLETSILLQGEVKKDIRNFTRKSVKLFIEPEHIIRLQQMGFTQKQIAFAYKKSERTIRRWLKPVYYLRQKVGRKEKIYGRVLVLLYLHVFKHPTATQQERADYLFDQTGRSFSQQIVSLALRRIGITYQVIPYRYSKQKALLPQLWEFIQMIKPLLQSQYLLAADESGFSLNLAPRRGWGRMGNKISDHKPGWANNYSLILMIQNIAGKGIIHWELIKGATNAEIFSNFLSNINLPANDEYHLLLDNVPFHKSVKVKKVSIQKNIKLISLVPYFPQLNPVEEIFNVIKAYVRKCRPRTKEELESAIARIVAKLQEEDLTKYFQNCLKFELA